MNEARPTRLAAAMHAALEDAGSRPLVLMDDGRRRTGPELSERTRGLAAVLAARRLVGRRVGLWLGNSFASIEAHLAAEWIGATRVPVDPGAAANEAADVFAAANVEVVIADAERAPLLAGAVIVHDDDAPAVGGAAPDPAEVPRERVLHLFPRSVENGELRGVPVTYGNWEARLDVSRRLYRNGVYGQPLDDDDVFLTAQQVMHGTSLTGTFSFLQMGLPQVLLERFDAGVAIDAIRRHAVTSTFLVPGMVSRIVQAARQEGVSAALPLRRVLYGGAPFPRQDMLDAVELLGDALFQLYGHWAGAWPISVLSGEDHLRIAGGDDGLARSCGRPIEDIEVELRPVSGSAAGETELCVRGPMVVPSFTDPDGWYGLGDTATRDGEGYLYLTGRMDGLINTGAYHVYPREIEEALLALDGVGLAQVVGKPDPKWGQAITAFVVPETSAALDEDALRGALRSRFAAYKVPKRIHFVEELPPASPSD